MRNRKQVVRRNIRRTSGNLDCVAYVFYVTHHHSDSAAIPPVKDPIPPDILSWFRPVPSRSMHAPDLLISVSSIKFVSLRINIDPQTALVVVWQLAERGAG